MIPPPPSQKYGFAFVFAIVHSLHGLVNPHSHSCRLFERVGLPSFGFCCQRDINIMLGGPLPQIMLLLGYYL